ncbi:hypothetical protein A5712_02535 [Mycobacterium sp. E2327]|uniref:hypothetical protein n=1 Tax=Mycobacterium sp. E2327 TaxID=1834132 RepID=UPI00080081F2|nr:hypothetical protein [Mycobacterium sp. E2327]OBI17423.1 hypothetical protein A5712_02535 [Mycobacterium sp. E2327]
MSRTAAAIHGPARAHHAPMAGDRVRVASGVFGRLGRIRSTSPGHVLVEYDAGGREVVDPTRRALWVVGRA